MKYSKSKLRSIAVTDREQAALREEQRKQDVAAAASGDWSELERRARSAMQKSHRFHGYK